MVASPLRDELNKVDMEDRLINSNFITSLMTGSALLRIRTTVTARTKTRIISQGIMKQIAIRSEITLKMRSRVQTESIGTSWSPTAVSLAKVDKIHPGGV